MKINRNMSAVITNKQLLRTEDKLAASMERLSSGYKINKAGDNPAGIAISNKMKAQIDALDKAQQNAADGTSVLQIADGALGEVSDILQRMRELSVQAANGTNSTSDRQSIQNEIDELKKEVNRISDNTEFNTKTLLDGSSDTRVYCDDATRMNISDEVVVGNYSYDIEAVAQKAELAFTIPNPATTDGSITINEQNVKITKGMTADDIKAALQEVQDAVGGHFQFNGNDVSYTSEKYGSRAEISVSVEQKLFDSGDFVFQGVLQQTDTEMKATFAGTDAKISNLQRYNEDTKQYEEMPHVIYAAEGNHVKMTDAFGFEMDFLVNKDYQIPQGATVGTSKIEVTDLGPMTLQIGANQYQTMDVRIPEISTDSLYLDEVDVVSYRGADQALVTLDDAISKLNEVRSRIGAFQNRVEYAESGLAETGENMTAAYSRILDTDMAKEMTEYTQQNILDQATISVLSQANDLPQQVLSLLG